MCNLQFAQPFKIFQNAGYMPLSLLTIPASCEVTIYQYVLPMCTTIYQYVLSEKDPRTIGKETHNILMCATGERVDGCKD